MRFSPRFIAVRRCLALAVAAALILVSNPASFASAYNAHPKLVVVIVIDQFRGDYLERYRPQFGEGGFRLFLDHGANFTDCNYDYANTRTAPGHATLFTGAYSNGHGIMANEWWEPKKKKMVALVEDDDTRQVGTAGDKPGASPHNLLADTLGDELKLATQGQARVFALSLKDRAAILPGGFAADAAYWIDPKTGAWITSTYYRPDLPPWAQEFNTSNRAAKYWDRNWESNGEVLRSTAHRKNKDGSEAGFSEVIGSTPFANEYELEFAKELVVYESLGAGTATDLLAIGLSPPDILGHQVGPDSPEMTAMVLALDRELADFFNFLGHRVGLANLWIALSSDHGISALPDAAKKLRIPAANLDAGKLEARINGALAAKFSPGHAAFYIKLDYPVAWLDQDAFAALHVKEHDAETAVGEAMKQAGLVRDYFTKSQLAADEVPANALARKFLNSYSPEGGWYVMGVPEIYTVGSSKGTDHASPYTYDTHVPLAFFGLPFRPGTYRTHAEPVDLAVTLSSLLGINAPTHAVGRVLTEALAPPHHAEDSAGFPKEGAPQ